MQSGLDQFLVEVCNKLAASAQVAKGYTPFLFAQEGKAFPDWLVNRTSTGVSSCLQVSAPVVLNNLVARRTHAGRASCAHIRSFRANDKRFGVVSRQ